MCTGGSRWVLGVELLGLPETHTAALTSLSFRGSLPPSKTVAILFNEETGPTPRKKPKKPIFQLILVQAFLLTPQMLTILTRNRRLKRKRKYLVTFTQPDPIFFHLQDLRGKQTDNELCYRQVLWAASEQHPNPVQSSGSSGGSQSTCTDSIEYQSCLFRTAKQDTTTTLQSLLPRSPGE